MLLTAFSKVSMTSVPPPEAGIVTSCVWTVKAVLVNVAVYLPQPSSVSVAGVTTI